MMRACFMRRLSLVAGMSGIAGIVALRPWYMRWGATDEELRRSLPGDAFAPHPISEATRAVTIQAPVEAVWQWLVQIGQDRAGFYSYSWLENLFATDMHNADRVHPEWQHLAAGDTVWMAPRQRYWGQGCVTAALVEPQRALVLVSPADGRTIAQGGLARHGAWAFILEPINAQTTRLIVRSRGDSDPTLLQRVIRLLVFDPAHFIMERQMMLGIKRRAEQAWARTAARGTLIDQVLPAYEFHGAASLAIRATPAQIFQALDQVTAADMPLANLLTKVRYLPGQITGRGLPEVSSTAPITQSLPPGWIVVAEAPEQEVVVGAIGKLHDLVDQQVVPIQDTTEFARFAEPDYQKLAISFRIDGGDATTGHVLTMEHRTHALDAGARWKFALYWWGLIKVGSAVMIHLMLGAIKQRAERLAAGEREVAVMVEAGGAGEPPPAVTTAPPSAAAAGPPA